MTKAQNASRIGKLLLQFPTIATVYSKSCTVSPLRPNRPSLDIRVQKADHDLMFLTARNAWHDGRMHFNRRQDDLRGCRWQNLYAVNKSERILARISAVAFDLKSLVIKDIFPLVYQQRSEDVEYLLWVTEYNWYACPSEEQAREDIIFGDFVESEVDVVVITKPKDQSWDQLVEQATKIKLERENAYKYPPKETPAYPWLHQALRSGATIHGFRSGGGLRVVHTINSGVNKEFYGEAPNVEEAFQYLEEDILAGGQAYGDVYGKLHPHYLTGSSQATSNLDCWLLNGHTLDFIQDGENVSVTLKDYTQTTTPPEIAELCKQHPGKLYRWQDRGFRYATVYRTHLFANGEGGHQTSCTNQKDISEKDPWFYPSKRTGIGKNIWEAFQNALTATPVETPRKD